MSYQTYLETHRIDCDAEIAAGNGVWIVCPTCGGTGRVFECGSCEEGHDCHGACFDGRYFKFKEELRDGDKLYLDEREGTEIQK